MSSSTIVLTTGEWNTSAVKYMAPKVNKSGGKAISIISTQTKRALHFSTPLLMTWGVSDFVDDKGESDGKFSISLAFPNEEYANPATNECLQKIKDFENQILDDAVKNSELWWGESMSREVAKHTFFPILKYSKHKDTKKIDYSKPPTIRAKVPFYNEKWSVEIYDTKSKQIFPDESNQFLSPIDLIPKMSSVACVLQCGGLWIGGKGWGVTWKLIQCIVKPRENISVYGKCQIKLSDDEIKKIETQEIKEEVDVDHEDEFSPVVNATPVVAPKQEINTIVQDSDDEGEKPVEVPKVEEVPKVDEVPAPPVEAPKKKVIKKKAT
jgi:hypothetical protein